MNNQPSRQNQAFVVIVAGSLLAAVIILFGSLQFATTRMQVTM